MSEPSNFMGHRMINFVDSDEPAYNLTGWSMRRAPIAEVTIPIANLSVATNKPKSPIIATQADADRLYGPGALLVRHMPTSVVIRVPEKAKEK